MNEEANKIDWDKIFANVNSKRGLEDATRTLGRSVFFKRVSRGVYFKLFKI